VTSCPSASSWRTRRLVRDTRRLGRLACVRAKEGGAAERSQFGRHAGIACLIERDVKGRARGGGDDRLV
jgi:hypothetical protein